jgi:phosphatidylinositol alpha-1,6-mannosyltransferase
MLICPSFYDGRLDGIGRVSGAFFQAMVRMSGQAPFVLSSNDEPGSCPPGAGRCFGRRYPRMLLGTLTLPALAGRSGASAGSGATSPNGSLHSVLPIVCTHLGLSPVARLAAARWHRRYVVFIHGVEAWRRLPRRSRWGLAGADHLLFNSEFTRHGFLRFNPWAAGIPSVVVPLGLTLAGGGAASPRPDPRPPGFRVLIVGRMTKAEYYENFRDATDLYKGFKQLILAVGELSRHVPGLELLMAGDGDARPDLEQWLAGRPEQAAVQFLGRVSDERLDQLYREADVFALPSEGEGFGLVFVEAMAHGLPSVCVRAGAAPEVVQDGETGLVARPRDVADLADKLYVLALNPTLRARLGRSARRRYESFYTAGAFEERIISALGLVGRANE